MKTVKNVKLLEILENMMKDNICVTIY